MKKKYTAPAVVDNKIMTAEVKRLRAQLAAWKRAAKFYRENTDYGNFIGDYREARRCFEYESAKVKVNA